MSPHHIARREQDEMVCTRCGKRWAVGEEPPDCQESQSIVKRDALYAPSTDTFI